MINHLVLKGRGSAPDVPSFKSKEIRNLVPLWRARRARELNVDNAKKNNKRVLMLDKCLVYISIFSPRFHPFA